MKSNALVLGGLILSILAAPQVHAQNYLISTFAGGGGPLSVPAPALNVTLGNSTNFAADATGNVYITSYNYSSIFKLGPNGVLTRVAGNGRAGYAGDGGPATSAQLSSLSGMVLDAAGNLFIADYFRVRRISPNGIITTVAGNGTPGFSGDGGPATDAQIAPAALAVDSAGNLFLAEPQNHRVRKVSVSGIISTAVGTGAQGSSGDGGPATSAQIMAPYALAVDSTGNLLIVDFSVEGSFVRKVSAAGIIGTAMEISSLCCFTPTTIALDRAGNVFFEDYYNRLHKVSTDGTISTIAGTGSYGYSGDGGPATSAQLSYVTGVAIDGQGNIFIGDGPRVRKISSSGIISTIVGDGSSCCFSGDGGPATDAQLNSPGDVAVDSAGNVFIADEENGRIRKVSPDGVISTVPLSGSLYGLWGLTADPQGAVLFTDSFNNVIRKVAPDGSSTIFAGNGTLGFSGDGGPATGAQLWYPSRVATDRSGNIFIMDGGGTRIRKVSTDGIITTLAGAGSNPYGFSGDGGPAVDAQLDTWDPGGCDGPGGGMAVDGAGDLYFADSYNDRVRRIDPNGIINTVAGNGSYQFSGDGGPLSNAGLSEPFSVAFDPAGNLFIADLGNSRVRKVTSEGIITTVAGNGSWSFSGDGGLATASGLRGPGGIAADRAGNIYVADTYNNAVRILRPTNLSTFIKTVVDAASQRADPVSPGKIVTIYGYGLGPSQLTQNQAAGGVYGTSLSGTSVTFNGIAAPLLYTSAGQVGVVVPYAITGASAQVTVNYQGQVSNSLTVPVVLAAPSLFTHNETGAGEAAAINTRDGTANSAANPVKMGDSISLFATGEGQTSPAGVDGNVTGSSTHPLLPVSAAIGGLPATVQSAGGAPGQVAGVMQVTLQVPAGVQTGGYVPVVLQVGNATSTDGAVWIAVSGN